MNRLSIAPLAIALALMTPAARAQTAQSARVTVCLDGTTTADVSSRACVRHSGINVDATRRLRAQSTNTSYGVYDARGNIINNGNQIPCGDGTYSTSGIHGCDARGGIASTTTQIRCTDGTLTAGGIHACATHGGVSTTQTNGQYNNGQYNNGQYNNGQYNNGQYNNGQYNGTTNGRNDRAAREERMAIRNGATAKCQDGTFSKAASRRGACVQHGGIATWYGKRK